MKKVSLILSLVLFMFLGGCLSKKTEQQLSEGTIPNAVGETTYVSKTKVDSEQNIYQASFFEFKYLKDEINLKDVESTGIVSGAETISISTKPQKTPVIKITSYENKNVNNFTEITALAYEQLSSDAKVTETAKGKITFDLAGTGNYSLGTISYLGITYYYYAAQVTKSLAKSGTSEPINFTYLIRVILKENSNQNIRYFEDVIKSLTPKEKVAVITNTNLDQEIKFFNDVRTALKYDMTDDVSRASTEKLVEDVYKYVENNAKYVPSSITGVDARREAAIRFVGSWKISPEAQNIGENIDTVSSNIIQAYIKKLSGECGNAGVYLRTEKLKVYKLPNISQLESALTKMIDRRVSQMILTGKDYGQEVNREYAIMNLREKYSPTFKNAVNYIVGHYIETVRVDGLGRDTKPVSESIDKDTGEKVYVWQQYQAIGTIYPILQKAIDYQTYLEIEIPEIKIMEGGTLLNKQGIAAREYIRKQAINNLKISSELIGIDKISKDGYRGGDTAPERTAVSTIVLEAIKEIKSEKLDNLLYETRDFFIQKNQLELSTKPGTILDKNKLTLAKNNIKQEYKNLVDFIKFYDNNIILTSSTFTSIDSIRERILVEKAFGDVQGTQPSDAYITNTNVNYAAIVLQYSNYYALAADSIMKYFDINYTLE